MLPTQRLSPKNQVTVPKEARALLAEPEVTHLRGLMSAIPKPGTNELFRVVLLMSESELQRREQCIRNDAALSGEAKMQLITQLNGGAVLMALDAQRRVVLPQHLVAYLGLDRDVLFISTNTTIQVWNPEQHARWAGFDGGTVYNPALTTYLVS